MTYCHTLILTHYVSCMQLILTNCQSCNIQWHTQHWFIVHWLPHTNLYILCCYNIQWHTHNSGLLYMFVNTLIQPFSWRMHLLMFFCTLHEREGKESTRHYSCDRYSQAFPVFCRSSPLFTALPLPSNIVNAKAWEWGYMYCMWF